MVTGNGTSSGERNNNDEYAARVEPEVAKQVKTIREEFERRLIEPRGNGKKEISYKEFRAPKPPMYHGEPDPLVSTRWISAIEGCFRTSECPPDKKTRITTNFLRAGAKDWLDGKIDTIGEEPFMSLSWGEFKKEFFEEFRTQADLTRMREEIRVLRQGSMDLNTLQATFMSKERFCPEYVNNERLLMQDFRKALNDELRGKISLGKVNPFADLFVVAKGFEPYPWEIIDNAPSKRTVDSYGAPSKRIKGATGGTSDVGKGTSSSSASRCFKCGERGHKFWECPASGDGDVVCFNCRGRGHRKAECPALGTANVTRRG
ncbi:uncharacterized protein [Rutidosis leptorrhynchoides]|uniref:uncharacterized protein n=1 Tax=Rutidosis leptorrhynchoides TaxID=125765 RepID=UPI003A99863B